MMKTNYSAHIAGICIPMLCVAPFLLACLVWVSEHEPTPLWLSRLL
jgi:hypothetical protein